MWVFSNHPMPRSPNNDEYSTERMEPTNRAFGNGRQKQASHNQPQPVEKVLAEFMINQMSLLFKELPKKGNKIKTRINNKNMIFDDKKRE